MVVQEWYKVRSREGLVAAGSKEGPDLFGVLILERTDADELNPVPGFSALER